MARFGTKVLVACLVFPALSFRFVHAEDANRVSYAIFAPGQSEKTTTALADLFSKQSPSASIRMVKTLPEAIASEADVAVLALSLAQFNALGPYDADALKQRKVIGIGFGAAKLFGEVGLKLSWGNCAHGMEPRIFVEENASIAKDGFDKTFGVYAANAKWHPSQDVEVMPFGIYLGDAHPGIRPGLDVIARFAGDRQYSPVIRQGNTILVGFSPQAEDFSELFGNLLGKAALSLNGSSKSSAEQPAAAAGPQDLEGAWVNADPAGSGLNRLKIAKDANGWSIEAWAPGGGNTQDIPWGPTPLDRLGESVAATSLPFAFATWDFGFKVTHLTARAEKDRLVVETFHVFKDKSGRSNYRMVGSFTKDAQTVRDPYPSLKRLPNFFSWEYADQPEPGKRIWIRVDDRTYIERYPSGHENTFRILRSDKANDVDGILLQISDSPLQAFIPYRAIASDSARSDQGQSNDHAAGGDPSAAARRGSPQLLMRGDERSHWQSMGDMNHVQ
jgi:hypothetical protein